MVQNYEDVKHLFLVYFDMFVDIVDMACLLNFELAVTYSQYSATTERSDLFTKGRDF